VRDLAIQPREDDLLVATHGRGIYVIDDIRCLRGLTPAVLASDATILESRPSVAFLPVSEQRFEGSEFRGRTLEEAATITYYLKKRHMIGDLKVEVYDAAGKLLSSEPGGKRRGINRYSWPMRLKPPKVPPGTNLVPNVYSFFGPRVAEGEYTVKLVKDKQTYESKLTLLPDPRSTHTAEDRAIQQKTVRELYDMLGSLTFVSDAVVDAREQVRARGAKLPKGDALGKKLASLAERLDKIHQGLTATREGRFTGEEQLREKLGSLYGAVNGFDGRPTESQLSYQQTLGQRLAAARKDFETLMTKDAAGLEKDLKAKSLEPIRPMSQEEWAKKQERG